MFNSPKSYENNYTLKGRTMFAKCLDKVCLGKLMILTIKSLQNAQLLTRNVEELSWGSLFYESYWRGMLMLRFINYRNIVSVNLDHAQKFQN